MKFDFAAIGRRLAQIRGQHASGRIFASLGGPLEERPPMALPALLSAEERKAAKIEQWLRGQFEEAFADFMAPHLTSLPPNIAIDPKSQPDTATINGIPIRKANGDPLYAGDLKEGEAFFVSTPSSPSSVMFDLWSDHAHNHQTDDLDPAPEWGHKPINLTDYPHDNLSTQRIRQLITVVHADCPHRTFHANRFGENRRYFCTGCECGFDVLKDGRVLGFTPDTEPMDHEPWLK